MIKFLSPSKNPPFWSGQEKAYFPPPQTLFKTKPIVERF
jgi:hypothetical protein